MTGDPARGYGVPLRFFPETTLREYALFFSEAPEGLFAAVSEEFEDSGAHTVLEYAKEDH